MRKSRFTDSQIMAVLKQAEVGANGPDLCREHDKLKQIVYEAECLCGTLQANDPLWLAEPLSVRINR